MPGSPLPLERMRMPSSMPAGILTCRVLLRRMRPTPSQAWQGIGDFLAVAVAGRAGLLHAEETLLHADRARAAAGAAGLGEVPGLAPEPLQVSQFSQLGTRISVSKPAAACSSVISSAYFRSAPR